MNNQILVLEDDLYYRTDISRSLRKYGSTHQAIDFQDFLKVIESREIDIAFLDLDLTKEQKKEGLKAIQHCIDKGITPVILTGHEDKETILEAYELGCAHYFRKADFQENLDQLVKGIFNSLNSKQWDDVFKQKFITNNETLKSKVKFLLEQSSDPNQNIMILGPTGVGKSKLAKLIHETHSENESFIHINLSEIPENLVESQLFGHKRGAFTGASSDHIGLIQRSNGGTLFLDEIGTLPITIQKKLLRVIEDKTITPLGSQEEIKVDFRLITATCDDLSSLIEEGDFRLDLYFRIKGVELDIPSLEKRKSDITPLIDFFIDQSSKKIAFSKEAQELLLNYKWYGNIRELQNLVKEFTISSKGLIQKTDLPDYIIYNHNPIAKSSSLEESSGFFNQSMREYVKENGLPTLINQIEKECLNEWKVRCDDRTNEIIRQLKVSKSLFYRISTDLKNSENSFLQ